MAHLRLYLVLVLLITCSSGCFLGPPGLQGPSGQDGKDGTPGRDGEQGPQGPQGPSGADGKDAEVDIFRPESSLGQYPDGWVPTARRGTIATHKAWYRGRALEYWDLGEVPVTTSKMFIFYWEGEKEPIAGQHPVLETGPHQPHDSPIVEVMRVDVPQTFSFRLNAIKSLERLKQTGFSIQSTLSFRACPIVSSDAALENNVGNNAVALQKVWVHAYAAQVFCFQNEITRTNGRIAYGQMGTPVVEASGSAEGGALFEPLEVSVRTQLRFFVRDTYTQDELRDLRMVSLDGAEASSTRLTPIRPDSLETDETIPELDGASFLKSIPLKKGWVDGKALLYWSFGEVQNKIGKVYRLVDANGPVTDIPAWIFAYPPGHRSYTPFVEIVEVFLPDSVERGGLRSLRQIQSLALKTTSTGKVIAAPIVSKNVVVEKRNTNELIEGWCRGGRVWWFPIAGQNALPLESGKLVSGRLLRLQHDKTLLEQPVFSSQNPMVWRREVVEVRKDALAGEIRGWGDVLSTDIAPSTTFVFNVIQPGSVDANASTPPFVGAASLPSNIPRRDGYSDGQSISFWDMGAVTPSIGALYRFVDVQGQRVTGQRDIIERLPGDKDATPFLEVIEVTVFDGYQADSIRSLASIIRAGLPRRPSGVVINCPVVAQNAQIQGKDMNTSNPLWVRGSYATCFPFETTLKNEGGFLKQGFMYAFFLPSQSMSITGQDVFDGMRKSSGDDAGYSPLRLVLRVDVPATFVRGDVKKVSDLKTKGFIPQSAGVFRNLPMQITSP